MKSNSYQEKVKKYTQTFYYSTLLFPPEIKNKVFLLYSFVRIIDDIVDKKTPQKKKFYFYKNELLNYLKGKKTSKIKIINDIGNLIKTHHFEKEMIDYLKIQEKELFIRNYQTERQLTKFIYGTAGTIGIMMAKILNLPSKTYPCAKKLGESLQIINIIRDLKEDFQRNKIYLPLKLLKKYGLTKQNFLFKKNLEKLYPLIKKFLNQAQKLKNEAEKCYRFFPKKILLPVKIAVDLYNQTAKKIIKNPNLIIEREKLKLKFWEIVKTIIKNYFFIYGLNKRN